MRVGSLISLLVMTNVKKEVATKKRSPEFRCSPMIFAKTSIELLPMPLT